MAKMTLTEQQKKVVENRGGTLLVSAAAGSGKTKVLVDRVMARITEEGRNINEFLIITFTNAAASELRSKISAAISQALASDPENRHLRRQQNMLHLAQISTVHAFCGNLIRQYGYLIEIPSDYGMLDDGERAQILDRLLTDLLEEQYQAGTPEFRQLSDWFGPGRNDSDLIDLIETLFETILSQPYPEVWMKSQTTYLDESTELSKTLWGKVMIENARQQLQGLISRYRWAIGAMEHDEMLIPKYLPLYEKQLADLCHDLTVFDRPWDEIGENLRLEDYRVVVLKHPDREFVKRLNDVKSDARALLKELRRMFSRPASELIAEQNTMAPALEALKATVLELYKRFTAEKRRKNLLDFSDQEHLAIRLLVDSAGKPTEVAREVSQSLCEIMVDEYQDSNRVQELIFTAISKSDDTNRFLVGDVKQSIYGFRQAEPEIFVEKMHSYLPAESAHRDEPRRLVLSKNFRSRPEILNAVNHVFRSVMSEDLGDITYNEDEHLYPGLPAYPDTDETHVELHVLNLTKGTEDDEDLTKYQQEAAWVANRIVELLNKKTLIRDGNELRPAEPADIALLFRSSGAMGIYGKALTQRGIPVAVGGAGDLFETPEVSVMMNLLRVIDNPHQDIPLLSVLCCPLFRFSNDELAQIRIHSKKRRFFDALSDSDHPECKRFLSVYQTFRKEARSLSADQLVWYLIQDTGLLTAYCSMENGEEHKNNLLTFYGLCQNAAKGGHIYLYELLRYLERVAENGYAASGEGKKGVILSTIHKSKGLEYPVVFLPDLSRKFNFRELSDPVIVDSVGGIGAKITDRTHRVRYPGIGYMALKELKYKALLSEELRILYVAMTRPKDYLIMTYSASNAVNVLQRLALGAGIPAESWAAQGAAAMGDWLLLSSLSRLESGELTTQSGYYGWQRSIDDYPWTVKFHEISGPVAENKYESVSETAKVTVPSPSGLIQQLMWTDRHKAASVTPSKLTATQLKGRRKDEEAAEQTPQSKQLPQLRRPEFIQEKHGLTAAEKGTATHLFLQYADFSKCDTTDLVMEELDRMAEEEFLTAQQAAAIDPGVIVRLFCSPLGERLRNAPDLVREFKFSLLTDASQFYADVEGEQLLLQGVIDAAIIEDDGITVVDFKTDRVTEASVLERAEIYKPQLTIYKKALERIWKKPIKATILYFLSIGKEVNL